MSPSHGSIHRLVAAIAAGESLTVAARAAGMSVSTVQRRLREPAVLAAVVDAQADLTREAVGQLREMRSRAMARTSEILETDSNPNVVLRAAELVLRHAAAADTAWLHDHVAAQERRLLELETNLCGLDD